MVKIKRWLQCFLIVYFYLLMRNLQMTKTSMYQIPDKSEPYNIQLMNVYLVGLLKKHLN